MNDIVYNGQDIDVNTFEGLVDDCPAEDIVDVDRKTYVYCSDAKNSHDNCCG